MKSTLLSLSLAVLSFTGISAQDSTLVHHMDFYLSAQILYGKESYQAVVHNMNLALNQNKAGEYYMMRANAHHKLGNFQQALADYNAASKKVNDPEL